MEILDIFPLKIIPAQVLLGFIGCPADEHSSRILFSYLHQKGITITVLVEAPAGGEYRDLILVVSKEVLHNLQTELEVLQAAIQAKALAIEEPVAVIRILGPHFDIRPGITGRLYVRLAKAGIKVLANSITATTSLLVVYESELEITQRELRAVFRTPKSK
jgi:aspartokinase